MTSKYDPYWTNRLSQVRAALGRAATGSPAVVELPGLASVGERGSWYGVTEVCGHEVTYGSMAHARSLGRIVAADGICAAGLLESWLGLPIAFLTAGAKAVIGTQRDIETTTSRYFFEELYGALARTDDLRDAFRAAQTATRQKFPDPLRWAAFYLLGDWR